MTKQPGTDALPDPLTTPDCDLRGFDFMPLYGGSFFSSSTYYQSLAHNPRAGLAFIRLLWHAWHQIPAASLPNDEAELAIMADFGSDLEAWNHARPIAMRGFVLCSDGRLYHRTLSNVAMEKFELRLKKARRRNTDAERLRAYRERMRRETAAVEEPEEASSPVSPDPETGSGTQTETTCETRSEQSDVTRNETRFTPRFETDDDTRSVSRVESESESESEMSLFPIKTSKKRKSVSLPEHVPQAQWDAYLDMRKLKKKPMTEYAVKKAFSLLLKLQAKGHDPADVLEQSVFCSWVGLHPVKADYQQRKGDSPLSGASASFQRLKERHSS